MPSLTRSVSFPVDFLPEIQEVEADFGRGGLSKFLRLSVEQYLAAKGANGKEHAKSELGKQLLKAQIETDLLTEQHARARRHSREKRLEELVEEDSARIRAGTASPSTTAEELVEHWWDRVQTAPAAGGLRTPVRERQDAAWRNLANRHGFRVKDVYNLVDQRLLADRALQASLRALPRGGGS